MNAAAQWAEHRRCCAECAQRQVPSLLPYSCHRGQRLAAQLIAEVQR